MKNVAVSGIGCVCAIGADMRGIATGLRGGRDGIRPVGLFPVTGCHSQTAGEMPAEVAVRAASIHAPARRWSRAAQVFLVATQEALAASPGFLPDAVIIGTTSGAMDIGENFFRSLRAGCDLPRAAKRVRGYPPQMPVLDALGCLGIRAPVRIISNACASGTNALGMAWQMIRSGAARRVLAGGYDTLSELVFAGFDCLRASTAERCRPFDSGRSGLVLGEGAAVFCVGGEGPLRISGYGAATDTHHLTQPHPSGSGPRDAMLRALEAAGLKGKDIDHVNAHGTATPQNDACEALAISAVCPDAPVTSTKAMTGHTLGAAGAIEAAFCAISLAEGFLPPTLNFRNPDPGVTLDIVSGEARKQRLRRVVSNSFGFGGSNASIVLEVS